MITLQMPSSCLFFNFVKTESMSGQLLVSSSFSVSYFWCAVLVPCTLQCKESAWLDVYLIKRKKLESCRHCWRALVHGEYNIFILCYVQILENKDTIVRKQPNHIFKILTCFLTWYACGIPTIKFHDALLSL